MLTTSFLSPPRSVFLYTLLLLAFLVSLTFLPSSLLALPPHARYLVRGHASLPRSWSPSLRRIALLHAFQKALAASFQAHLTLEQMSCLSPLLQSIQKRYPAAFVFGFRILSEEATRASLLLHLEVTLQEASLLRFLQKRARLWQDQNRLPKSCSLPTF